jgi:ribosome-binding factor A
MSRRGRSRSAGSAGVPRTARLNHVLQEIIAEELERIDDERLGLLTVVAVEVSSDLRRATVWYTTLSSRETDEDLVAALEAHRAHLQRTINRQTRLRRTPVLAFRPDVVTRQAERVEDILRGVTPPEAGEPRSDL